MKNEHQEQWPARVQQLAAELPYPPTPDLTAAVHRQLSTSSSTLHFARPRHLAWALLFTVLLLLAGALAIPPVRAAVAEWLQIGSVRIWRNATPTPHSTSRAAAEMPDRPLPMGPNATLLPTTAIPRMAPPHPTASVLDLTGATTLETARAAVEFPIHLPTLPVDLGAPDRVYLQRAEGDTVILVWLRPTEPTQVAMSLHLLGPGAFIWKMQPPTIAETTVHGQEAFWTTGPYYVQTDGSGSWANRRLVDGHVLIWTDGDVTYRLESDLTLAQAIQVAESIGR